MLREGGISNVVGRESEKWGGREGGEGGRREGSKNSHLPKKLIFWIVRFVS